MEGGWWRQLSSPVGRADRLRRSSLTSGTKALYIVLVLLAGTWIVFQMSFVPNHNHDSIAAKVPRHVLLSHPDLLLQTQRIGASNIGYAEQVLPDSIIDVIKDDPEEDLDATLNIPSRQTNSDGVSIDDPMWDFTPPRLSPVLKGRSGKKVLGRIPTKKPDLPKADSFALTWEYGAEDKLIPYVGNSEFMAMFDPAKERRAYLNSLAVFPFSSNSGGLTRFHGHVGVYPNGTQAWIPDETPPPIDKVNKTEALRKGGFYLKLANALEMDREVKDNRQNVCTRSGWDYKNMSDASVVITFYNEPLATLLRTVHSVLNYTPPSILREIILVDDHSSLPENGPGDDLYEYVKLLPKTKILRLPERRGLVWARLAGAQAAQGKVLVVLDSHVEVNPGWLEPQMQRLAESPQSIVFPQIMALDPLNFDYLGDRGIGCWLSWKWNMVEQASLTGELENEDPIPSPSMAGGLFAVNLDWFWKIGGYDEEFSMWGSENVEMGFRTWMCGGRMECTPCALTYHIYREGGTGYHSPDKSVWVNKLRTSRLWMDEHFLIAKEFIKDDTPIGNYTGILEMKKRLNCKSFKWFMENIDPTHDIQDLDDVQFFGEIRLAGTNICLDSLSHKEGGTFGIYQCHKRGGTQRWLKDRNHTFIRSGVNDGMCLGRRNKSNEVADPNESNSEILYCSDWRAKGWTYLNETKQFRHVEEDRTACLTVLNRSSDIVRFEPCSEEEDPNQQWEYDEWIRPEYIPLE